MLPAAEISLCRPAVLFCGGTAWRGREAAVKARGAGTPLKAPPVVAGVAKRRGGVDAHAVSREVPEWFYRRCAHERAERGVRESGAAVESMFGKRTGEVGAPGALAAACALPRRQFPALPLFAAIGCGAFRRAAGAAGVRLAALRRALIEKGRLPGVGRGQRSAKGRTTGKGEAPSSRLPPAVKFFRAPCRRR